MPLFNRAENISQSMISSMASLSARRLTLNDLGKVRRSVSPDEEAFVDIE